MESEQGLYGIIILKKEGRWKPYALEEIEDGVKLVEGFNKHASYHGPFDSAIGAVGFIQEWLRLRNEMYERKSDGQQGEKQEREEEKKGSAEEDAGEPGKRAKDEDGGEEG